MSKIIYQTAEARSSDWNKKEDDKVIFDTTGYSDVDDPDWVEYFKDHCEANDIVFADMSDQDKYNLLHDMQENSWEDTKLNINKELNGRIIAIADLGRWNGRFSAYKLLRSKNLKTLLDALGGSVNDISRWFDGVDVKGYDADHDATSYFLFRELKEEEDTEKFLNIIYTSDSVQDISQEDIDLYTKPIGHHIAKVFGWEVKK